MTEKVICAAVMHEGKIWFGHRHYHALQAMNDELSYHMTRQEISALKVEQGFVTSVGRFVNRYVAMDIQKAAGIKPVDTGRYRVDVMLFSEDLY